MKFSRREVAKLAAVPILFHIAKSGVRPATAAQSGDGETREAVQAAMLEYIDVTAINGRHLIFDPIKGDYISAKFKTLHTNMSLVANTFYVSCADFEDTDGKLVDVDYMVASVDEYWTVFQSVVHKRDGILRESHMEDAQVLFAKEGCCASSCCSSKCCASSCCSSTCCASSCCSSTCCASSCCSSTCCASSCCSSTCCASN